MARFYGTIQGARGPTSRLGHTSSGLDVTAQSYSGDVRINLFAGEGDVDWVGITACPHGGGTAVSLYYGPIKHLVDVEGHNFLIQQMARKALGNAFEPQSASEADTHA